MVSHSKSLVGSLFDVGCGNGEDLNPCKNNPISYHSRKMIIF